MRDWFASSTIRGGGRRLLCPIVLPPQNWFPTVACEVIYHRSFQFPSPHHTALTASYPPLDNMLISCSYHTQTKDERLIRFYTIFSLLPLLWHLNKMMTECADKGKYFTACINYFDLLHINFLSCEKKGQKIDRIYRDLSLRAATND